MLVVRLAALFFLFVFTLKEFGVPKACVNQQYYKFSISYIVLVIYVIL